MISRLQSQCGILCMLSNYFFCLPLLVAVLLQLYRMASSPKTFPGGSILKNLPCRDTSTLPSEKIKKVFQLLDYLNVICIA